MTAFIVGCITIPVFGVSTFKLTDTKGNDVTPGILIKNYSQSSDGEVFYNVTGSFIDVVSKNDNIVEAYCLVDDDEDD